MPETRINRIEHYANDEQGGGLVSVEEIPYEVSDDELAEEAEQKTMGKAEELIDSIGNMNQAKLFLKRLVRRLIKNGVLP